MLHKLQGLKFLDFQPVKDAERAEAKKRGQFTAVARPSDDGGGAEGEEAEVNAPPVGLPGRLRAALTAARLAAGGGPVFKDFEKGISDQ